MSNESQDIGPYRISGVLGHGTAGAVYRAQHRRTGRHVALKTVRALWPGALPSLRREIHALARIRHPGIVRVFESGVHEGLPWFSMELVQGQTLRQFGAGLPLHEPEALGRLLEVVVRLCSALAYLHGEGLIHRDLKPENILIPAARGERRAASGGRRGKGGRQKQAASGEWPVLVDFGVSAQFGGVISREELTVDSGAMGTLTYMAPEQIRGELLDARADLYALGCILFELLSGRAVFEGSVWEVRQAHLLEPPPALSDFCTWAPAALDELLARLLAKEPSERIGHASDVAWAVQQLGATAEGKDVEPAPRAYLYRARLAGRARPMEALLTQLDSLQSGRGGLVLIGGESGVGKTRLAMELGREARRRKLRVLTGECTPDRGLLEPLRKPLQAIADRCRERGEVETERLLGRRGKLLARYEPTLADLPGQERHPEPVDLDPKAAQMRLESYLFETFAALTDAGGAAGVASRAAAHPGAARVEATGALTSSAAPLLLILDDVQWADDLTLGFLEYLLRAPGHGHAPVPILVAVTYRTEEVNEPLSKLSSSPDAHRVGLGRLEPLAVAAMVGDMLAMTPAPELFSSFLSRHSEGNPFFVAEYLRLALAEGLLFRDQRGRWQVTGASDSTATAADYDALPLPHSLRELVLRRLDGLSPTASRLAETGSVLGRDVDLNLCALMMPRRRRSIELAVQELLLRQVMTEEEPGRLRFVHDKIREVAYERIRAQRRREVHRSAAAAIEAQFGVDRPEHFAELGHHWELAGAVVRARECYVAAARYAVSRYAHGDAERLYRSYLELVERPTSESLAARNELGEDLHLRGRPREAIRELARALDEARELGDRVAEAQSLQTLANVQSQTSRLEEAQSSCMQAIQIRRELGDRRGEGSILGNLGVLAVQQGRSEQARELFEQALAIVRETGDREREGFILINLAILQLNQGYLEDARIHFGQVLVVAREIGNRRMEGAALYNLACLDQDQGRPSEALALYEQALVMHREVGNRRFEGVSLGGIGELYHLQGRLEDARRHLEQALAIHREVDHRRFEARTLIRLGSLSFDQGQAAESRSFLDQAVGLARQGAFREEEAMAIQHAAILERRTGDNLGPAAALLLHAESVAQERGHTLHLGQCRCERGHLELAQGRSAGEYLIQAQELASKARVGAASELGRAIWRLGRALDAFKAGRPLFRGECVEDLPEGLQRWLVQNGHWPAVRSIP